MTTATAPTTLDRHWPAEGVTRVPFWAYSDPQVYEQEMSRIFCGESWAYVGLEVEIPHAGDFKQVTIGDRPVVMVPPGPLVLLGFAVRRLARAVLNVAGNLFGGAEERSS